MPRKLLLICLISVLAIACAPTTSETDNRQTEDSTEATDSAHEEEETHAEDEHDAEDHHDEGEHDADEHHDEDEHDADEHHDEDEHSADEHRELGAHEHGAAELTVALSGNEVAINLQTPAFNVLGFEYAPTSDAEKGLLEESVAVLEAGSLMQMNSDAQCTLTSATIQVDIADEEHEDEEYEDEEHSDDAHEEETHSDIDVSYTLDCQQPDIIESLDASALFEQFPNFEGIAVQWISDTQQSAANLTPEDPLLMFK